MKKRIMLVFGTRPEAIKMAPIYHAIKEQGQYELTVCISAQHREMLDNVLDTFNIDVDHDLDIMSTSRGLHEITSNIILGLEKLYLEIKPDIVLVHGDTTTALAAGLAAFYSNVKIGHIEAGLRTNNIKSPFPEEFNRQVLSKISSIHFSPTIRCAQCLKSEGVDQGSIFVTGNTVIDAMNWILRELDIDKEKRIKIESSISLTINFPWMTEKYVLITSHRRENLGDGLSNICSAVKILATKYPHVSFVFPVHPNPNVTDIVYTKLNDISNIYLIDPLCYEEFLYLMKRSYIILTDSGGIQEEAPSLGKPVLVTRSETERSEAVAAGTVRLVGTSKDAIIMETSRLLDDPEEYGLMSNAHNPYGDGLATQRIMQHLMRVI